MATDTVASKTPAPKELAWDVVLAHDYCAALLELISKAQRRVVITAMVVRSGQHTGPVLRAAAEAAGRGVKVHILGDIYSQHGISRPSVISRHAFKSECLDTRRILANLQANGGRSTWVGRMGLNPYAHRYHAKMTVIDDHVYSFGGVNFSDDSMENIDYMLHTEDAALATKLQQLAASNADGLPAADLEVPLGKQNSLLFDAGTPGSSIIYDRACQLAAQSAKVTYVSQMYPSGRLGQLISHTQNTCYFNRPWQTGLRPDSLAQAWDGWRGGIPNHYTGSHYVHAKLILFELKDGTKAVLSGSHNFSKRGVTFGTKEIALYSTSPALWRKLQDVIYAVATSA